jgi:post-segregation antitoxin (ccd killing protein)
MKKKSTSEPPNEEKRERGRPSQGKTRINLTLNESLVERARAKEDNLSALLDRLLTQWLEKAA